MISLKILIESVNWVTKLVDKLFKSLLVAKLKEYSFKSFREKKSLILYQSTLTSVYNEIHQSMFHGS